VICAAGQKDQALGHYPFAARQPTSAALRLLDLVRRKVSFGNMKTPRPNRTSYPDFK